MKRKDSCCATEASFDTLMADAAHTVDLRVESVETEQIDLEQSKKCLSPDRQEVYTKGDKDSDYEGSDFENKGDVTTLRMLFEKCRSSDFDFYESCLDVGLLSPLNSRCLECDAETPIIEAPTNIDNLLRRCTDCDVEWSIRRDSWCEGIEASLKDLILTVYCWCRNYTQVLASHETDVDLSTVSLIYSKCCSVGESYFNNPMSNLGGDNCVILTDIFSYNDRTLFGMIDNNSDNVFYQILNSDFDESQIVTILIDNLTPHSIVLTDDQSRLSRILDPECKSYLKESWDISFKTENISTNPLILKWTDFETQLPPVTNIDPTYQSLNSDLILNHALFRKRMENSRDCFLFFLTIISELFNNSYS